MKPEDIHEDYHMPWATMSGVCTCSTPDRRANWHGRCYEMGAGSFRRNVGKTECKTRLDLVCTACGQGWQARGFKGKYWLELGLPVEGGEHMYWSAFIAFGRLYARCTSCPGAGVYFKDGEKLDCPECTRGMVQWKEIHP